MLDSYWESLQNSRMDILILFFGFAILCAHLAGVFGRLHGGRRLFVQGIDKYRTFLLLLTEILPMLGLLGTVISLLNTFKSFQMASGEQTADLSGMIQTFAPAMTTTISGLLMAIPNLVLNAFLWMLTSDSNEKEGSE